MATFVGVPAGAVGFVFGAMSSLLSGASLPAPATAASYLAPVERTGALVTHSVVITPGTRAGAREAGHDEQCFERIHVVPRTYDLAFLLSEQTVPVEVWNAFRPGARQLTAVNVTGSAGLSVDTPPTPPVWYAPLHSDVFTIRASSLGAVTIANTVVWVFAGVPTSGTDLQLTGTRLVPWPFPPDSGTIVEKRGYASAVLEAYDVTEQRAQLRASPTRGFRASFPLLEPSHARYASALLQDWLTRPFGVPLWQYQAPLAVTAASGALSLSVDTTGVPWADGDAVILWRDPYTWEAVAVASVGVGSITLAAPTRATWPAGSTRVMPLAIGWGNPQQAFNWEDVAVAGVELDFVLEVNA